MSGVVEQVTFKSKMFLVSDSAKADGKVDWRAFGGARGLTV